LIDFVVQTDDGFYKLTRHRQCLK